MCIVQATHLLEVHCRTGSLESFKKLLRFAALVHCRTGSLETSIAHNSLSQVVHCRTGSLESLLQTQ